jgi:cold shock CspA family protein
MLRQGTVKFWHQKGYAFIADSAGGRDEFVHAIEVRKAGFAELRAGQRVQYRIAPSPKSGKDQAIDLELLPPIISPPVTPHAFRVEDDLDDATAHMALATQAFMKR